jgi:acetoin utilization deacetylase AcuC-like enzyme
MAGVWMFWKSYLHDVKEIFLESEVEAEGFYISIGFHTRGPYTYILKSPQGSLLTTIAAMAVFSKKTHPSIISHLCKRIAGRIRLLKRGKDINGQRKRALEFIKIALHPASSDLLARAAMGALLKHRRRIPEAEVLLALAKAFGRMETDPRQKALTLPVSVVIDKRSWQHLKGVTHLENYRRIKAAEEVLKNRCLEGKWFKIASRFAEKDELTWVHTLEYVEKVEKTAGKSLSAFDVDTQTTEASWSTARLAAGGLFSLLDGIMTGRSFRGFAFIRPPGHHAKPNNGMGFCIFNNIALGAKYLKHKYKVSKLMIIDIDAHHGNGTQEVFYDTDDVLFVSIHESGSFPGTGTIEETGIGKGEGFTINIPLEKGGRARDIGRALYFIAGPVAQAYGPEMILVSFGFDLYIHDRMSGMKVTPSGYARITALLLEIAAHSTGGKIAFVMEGGYSLEGIRECGLTVMEELCNVSKESEDKIDQIRKSDLSRLSSLKKIIQIHKKYWKVLP